MMNSAMSGKEALTVGLLGKNGEFTAWFRLYEDLVSLRRFNINPPTSTQAIPHATMLKVARILKNNLTQTRDDCVGAVVRDTEGDFSEDDLKNALNIAVQASFMVDCVATEWHASDFRLGGVRPTCWEANEDFCTFMTRTFPLSTKKKKARVVLENYESLKGWKLAKRIGISFKLTNNLADHLLYDRRHRTVYLFHQVAFLDAQLSGLARNLPFESGMKTSLSK
jgi:hypothetical protein